MTTFKDLISRLRPANKDYQYIEVKELSEIMEAAREAALFHTMMYRKAKLDYKKAAERYALQCKRPKMGAF